MILVSCYYICTISYYDKLLSVVSFLSCFRDCLNIVHCKSSLKFDIQILHVDGKCHYVWMFVGPGDSHWWVRWWHRSGEIQCHQGHSRGTSSLIMHHILGPWFNTKMLSYQYRKSHCGNKTVERSSHLHNEISYTGEMSSLYWIGALNWACHLVVIAGANTVWCLYNVVNFLTNIHKRHSIAHLLGRGKGCLLWIQHLIDILPQFL